MRYNYSYKYYKINDMIIQLSVDNTLNGKDIYMANTNTLFQNIEGDWGHACGVGKNEEIALEMCIKEINDYTTSSKSDIANKQDLKEIELPYMVTFQVYKDRYATCFFKTNNNTIEILSDTKKQIIECVESPIDTIKNNIKLFKNSQYENFTKEYLQKNNFYPTFDKTFYKEREL